MEQIKDGLLSLTSLTLGNIYKFLIPSTSRSAVKSKEFMANEIAKFLISLDREQFTRLLTQQESWFQKAITEAVLWEFVDFKRLEIDYDVKLAIRESTIIDSYYTPNTKEYPGLALFAPHQSGYMWLFPIFRTSFRPFIDTADAYVDTGESAEPSAVWSNEEQIFDTFGLMVQASDAFIKKNKKPYIEDWISSGLNKGMIKEFRSLCGQKGFPLSKDYGLDPIDLFFRWYLSFRGAVPIESPISPSAIKQQFKLFFEPQQNTHKQDGIRVGSFFEFAVLTEHLSLRRSNDAYIPSGVPDCRCLFLKIFKECAETQRWYSVEQLYYKLFIQGKRFSYVTPYTELYGLSQKGDFIEVHEDRVISADYQHYIPVRGPQFHVLMGLPVFKGYWYLMAVLGLVELTEKVPQKPLVYNDKRKVVSVFDSLDMVRVTKLGSFCLSLVDEYATVPTATYEAIADKDLLLVTFRGKSLERKLFLDQIGRPLGAERYRVDEKSFLRGCSNKEDLRERIAKFKLLIDAKPSQRWLTLFKNIEARFHIIKEREGAMIYDISTKDPAVSELIHNEKLRALFYVVEGNKIAVPAKNLSKFKSLCQAEGFFISSED